MSETPSVTAKASCSTLVNSISATTLSGRVKELALVEQNQQMDTIPQQVSDETLNLIGQIDQQLNADRPGPPKRARTEGPSNDPAAGYPAETKPLYLKSKNLYRKKLTIATRLSVLKKYFGKKTPYYTAFRCPVPSIMKNPLNRSRWEDKIKDTKGVLLHLLIEDMEEQYKATKAEIANLEATLRDKLNDGEWVDLQNTLHRKYKAAVQFQLRKSERLFPSERRVIQARRRQPQKNSGQNQGAAPQQRKGRKGPDNNIGALLKKFTNELQKINK